MSCLAWPRQAAPRPALAMLSASPSCSRKARPKETSPCHDLPCLATPGYAAPCPALPRPLQLRPAQTFHLESTVKPIVPRSKPADPDKFSGFRQVVDKRGLIDRVVHYVKRDLSRPLRNDGEASHNSLTRATDAVKRNEEPLARYVTLLNRQ